MVHGGQCLLVMESKHIAARKKGNGLEPTASVAAVRFKSNPLLNLDYQKI